MKNKKIKFLIIISIILFTLITFIAIDFSRVKNGKKPLFVLSANVYIDGGSKEYYGLGYKVLKCNTLIGDKSIKIGTYNMKYSCKTSLLSIDTSDFEVIDETEMCAQALEQFYEDDDNVYYFNCIKSATTFVKFVDGTKMTIKDAVNNELITIEQLQNKFKENDYINIIVYQKAKNNDSINNLD